MRSHHVEVALPEATAVILGYFVEGADVLLAAFVRGTAFVGQEEVELYL